MCLMIRPSVAWLLTPAIRVVAARVAAATRPASALTTTAALDGLRGREREEELDLERDASAASQSHYNIFIAMLS